MPDPVRCEFRSEADVWSDGFGNMDVDRYGFPCVGWIDYPTRSGFKRLSGFTDRALISL